MARVGRGRMIVVARLVSVAVGTARPAMAEEDDNRFAKDFGYGVGAFFTNLIYMPAKFTYATLGAALVLGVAVSTSWLIWGGIILVLLRFSGFEHPPAVDEREPLDRTRVAISILAIIIFALCFTPWPITPQELISR